MVYYHNGDCCNACFPVSVTQRIAMQLVLRRDGMWGSGDILLNHNLTSFHSRTTWQDGSTEDTKRHMFRIWAASPFGWCDVFPSSLSL